MKTIEQILAQHVSKTLDGRDFSRLGAFLSVDQLILAGLQVAEGQTHTPKEFNRDNVLAQLKNDVAFGFEKALNKRGISAGMMFSVVQMWNWVLEEGLEGYDEDSGYAQYGLPLFKATAVKYGFSNPIGDDAGDEYSYSAEADYDD